MTGFVSPIPLPAAAREVEAHWNFVELAVAIDVIDAEPAKAIVLCDAPLVMRGRRHKFRGTLEIFERQAKSRQGNERGCDETV